MTPTIDLLRSHRSIRHFTDQQVTRAQREAIIDSARGTSSSSFLQCSSIIRITDPAMREQLVTLTGGQKHGFCISSDCIVLVRLLTSFQKE